MKFSSLLRLGTRCCRLGLALVVTQALWAQGLRAPSQGGSLRPSPSPLPLALTSAPAAQRLSSDFIVAVFGVATGTAVAAIAAAFPQPARTALAGSAVPIAAPKANQARTNAFKLILLQGAPYNDRRNVLFHESPRIQDSRQRKKFVPASG